MQLFYTGASSYLGTQNDPFQSLGGYISNSLVPNNQVNNIFGDLSWQNVRNKKVATRGLILKNTTGFDCTDVLFGYEYPAAPAATFKLEVAFVSINQNQIERIVNGESSPIMAVFEEANILPSGPDNSLDVGALANNVMIGLWLRLTPLLPLTPPAFNTVDDQITWWKNVSDPDNSSLQTINIKIKYSYNQ